MEISRAYFSKGKSDTTRRAKARTGRARRRARVAERKAERYHHEHSQLHREAHAAQRTQGAASVTTLEDRAFSMWLHVLQLKRPGERWTGEQLEEAYEHLQARLSEGRFSEETCASIDYVVYTAIRCALAVTARGIVLRERPSPRLLVGLVNTVTRFSLYAGALVLAVEEPTL